MSLELQHSGTTISAASSYTFDADTSGVTTATFGGKEDLWQMDEATAASFLDNNFGLKITPFVDDISSTYSWQVRYTYYYVEVKVYFSTTIDKYYFWNGTDDVTADITNFFVTDGAWDTGDAEGNIQFTNIQPVSPGTRSYITNGDQIRTAANGQGLLIATINSDAEFNRLD